MSDDRNKDIATNIKKYIKLKGITQKELADKIDISPSTLSDYLNLRSNPSHGVIQKIADYFGIYKSDIDTSYKEQIQNGIVSIYEQLEKTRQQKVYNYAERQLEEQNKVIHIHKDNGDYITETLRGYLSAGTGELQLEEVIEEIEIPVEMIPEQHYDMLLQINGDSMLPMFQDGERIFVRKISEPSELRSGQIGVFIIDGESFLKKAYKEDNQLRLVSLNDKYEDLIFNEVNDIEVVGTVVM